MKEITFKNYRSSINKMNRKELEWVVEYGEWRYDLQFEYNTTAELKEELIAAIYAGECDEPTLREIALETLKSLNELENAIFKGE